MSEEKVTYGVSRIDQAQDIQYFVIVGESIGFKVTKVELNNQTFKIIFKK